MVAALGTAMTASAGDGWSKIEGDLPRFTELDDVPALVVAEVDIDGVVHHHVAGWTRNDGSGREVDRATVFRGASLSKSIAGATAVALARTGEILLDQPVQQSLPAFELRSARATAELTLEHLLSHRTGLPSNAFDKRLEGGEDVGLLVEDLATVTLSCQPGRCYWYQNIAFNLSAQVIEAETKSSYEGWARQLWFEPLGMGRASFGLEALVDSTNAAAPHVYADERWQPTLPLPTYYQLPAAAGVNLSLDDLALWARALLGAFPEVLDAATIAELTRARTSTPPEFWGSRWRRERLDQAHYGLGLRVYRYQGLRVWFHGGAVMGFRAFMVMLPGDRRALIALWNSDSPRPFGLIPTWLDAQVGLTGDWLDFDKPIPNTKERRLAFGHKRAANQTGTP